MQICPRCKKEIRYIAKGYDSVIECEVEKTVVYTETGRRVEGYALHICKGVNDGSNKENEQKSG